MKTSLTKLSSSFILLTLSLSVFAKPVAQVTELTGSVFIVTAEGKTSALKLNEHIEERSEIMVEEGASISINDYFDATYHLTGGSHLKMFNKSVQLKKGKTWIQSNNARHPLALTTANGHVDFWKGEFITTFDQVSSRTQVLVVNGDVQVSNILDENLRHTVEAGHFTMVDPEVESGAPRPPTKVGAASLSSALAEFKKIPEKNLEATPAPERAIASVEEAPVKRGEIIYISTNRLPASVGSAHSYYKKTSWKAPKKVDVANVPIRFYGTNYKPATAYVAPVAPREPASIPQALPVVQKKQPVTLGNDHEFTESLKKHSSEQPKYSKELDSLINDLKSY